MTWESNPGPFGLWGYTPASWATLVQGWSPTFIELEEIEEQALWANVIFMPALLLGFEIPQTFFRHNVCSSLFPNENLQTLIIIWDSSWNGGNSCLDPLPSPGLWYGLSLHHTEKLYGRQHGKITLHVLVPTLYILGWLFSFVVTHLYL